MQNNVSKHKISKSSFWTYAIKLFFVFWIHLKTETNCNHNKRRIMKILFILVDNIFYKYNRILPPSTKQLTDEINPLRNELNGNVPTRQQYTNCTMPVNKTYSKYASIIFNFFGVYTVYSLYNL